MIVTDVSVLVKARCEKQIDLDRLPPEFRVIGGNDTGRRTVVVPGGATKVIVGDDGDLVCMGAHDDLSALNSIFDVVQAAGVDSGAVHIRGFSYEVLGNLCRRVSLDDVELSEGVDASSGATMLPSIQFRFHDSCCKATVYETGAFHLSGATDVEEVGHALRAVLRSFPPVIHDMARDQLLA